MANPKTGDVLRDLDLEHRRKRKLADEIHESRKALVRDLCDAGLVQDVDPDSGAVSDTPEILCAVCGREIPDPLLTCPLCNEEAEEIEW